MTVTRRERLRNAVLQDIKTIALRQMVEQGTAAVSLRAIAREIAMSPAALYRYYASRDDLITALILDSYTNLGQALQTSYNLLLGEPPPAQILGMTRAYRNWALEHPIEYQLIFGNPIPGYSAPMEVTQPAAQRAFIPLAQLLLTLWQEKSIHVPEMYEHIPETIQPHLETWGSFFLISSFTGDACRFYPLLYLGVILWTRLHGLVTLELFHQLTPMVGDPAAMFEHECRQMIYQLGIK